MSEELMLISHFSLHVSGNKIMNPPVLVLYMYESHLAFCSEISNSVYGRNTTLWPIISKFFIEWTGIFIFS